MDYKPKTKSSPRGSPLLPILLLMSLLTFMVSGASFLQLRASVPPQVLVVTHEVTREVPVVTVIKVTEPQPIITPLLLIITATPIPQQAQNLDADERTFDNQAIYMTRGQERFPTNTPVYVITHNPQTRTIRVRTLVGGIEATLHENNVYTPASNPSPTPTVSMNYLNWEIGTRVWTLEELPDIQIYSYVTIISFSHDHLRYRIRSDDGVEVDVLADQITDW